MFSHLRNQHIQTNRTRREFWNNQGDQTMNIDFHYAVIYAIARLAGLEQCHATTVAHACQYVDDSTVPGVLEFAEGETYERFASAHSMFDYHNAQNSNDKRVWAPFHFLPACEGNTFEDRSVCRPNSLVAQEMVQQAIKSSVAEHGFHRLGITLHVYVDTWAHQGFSGTISRHNVVKRLISRDHEQSAWEAKLRHYCKVGEDMALTELLDVISRLGHGAAIHFPDLPWANWSYVNGHGTEVSRDNLPQFIDAADMAFRAIKGYQHQNVEFTSESGLPDDTRQALTKLLGSIRSDNEIERLDAIANAIARGDLPGLQEEMPVYVAKGIGSWKYAATGIVDDKTDGNERPYWSAAFEQSDYRKFHDAVKEHRFIVTQKILLQHGMRLA
jgi:hypothetical protein